MLQVIKLEIYIYDRVLHLLPKIPYQAEASGRQTLPDPDQALTHNAQIPFNPYEQSTPDYFADFRSISSDFVIARFFSLFQNSIWRVHDSIGYHGSERIHNCCRLSKLPETLANKANFQSTPSHDGRIADVKKGIHGHNGNLDPAINSSRVGLC